MEDKNVGSVNANNGTECCSEWWDLHNHLTWKISYLSSSELYSYKFFSQQCVYRYFDWLCSAFVKCAVQLEAVTSPSPPRQPSGIWQWSVPREWGIWHKRHSGSAGFETCPGEVGNLNRNCQVSPAEYSQVSIFVIEEIQIWLALTPAQRTQYWRQLHHHDLWQF